MKIINKEIEAVVFTNAEGFHRPLRIRLEENDELQVIEIKIILKTEDIMNGRDKTIKYYCECVINERKQIIELLYETMKTRWILYRI